MSFFTGSNGINPQLGGLQSGAALAQQMLQQQLAMHALQGQQVQETSSPERLSHHELILRAHMNKYDINSEKYSQIYSLACEYIGNKIMSNHGDGQSYTHHLYIFCENHLCNMNFNADVKEILGE